MEDGLIVIWLNRRNRNFTLDQIHVDGARKIAKYARELGIPRLIHVSALNADEKSSAEFFRVKVRAGAYNEHFLITEVIEDSGIGREGCAGGIS